MTTKADEELLPLTAKCEACSVEQHYKTWPQGWVQTGTSRFGRKYQSSGLAWRCPEHHDVDVSKPSRRRLESYADLERLLKDTQDELQRVLAENRQRGISEDFWWPANLIFIKALMLQADHANSKRC